MIENGRTKVVLPNDDLSAKNPFALEKHLRMLKGIESTYIVAVLDCCRQEASGAARELVRGVPVIAKDLEDSEESQQNLILIFGCEPSYSVKAESVVSRTFVKHLSKQEKDGELIFPDCIIFYNSGCDAKIEKTIIVC